MSADSLTRKKILELLDHHETAAGALRMTLDLLDGEAKEVKKSNGAGIIAKALAIDEARVQKKKPRSAIAAAVRSNRINTAAHLAEMSTTEPRPYPGGSRAVASVANHGYIKKSKTKGLYLRTNKEFIP